MSSSFDLPWPYVWREETLEELLIIGLQEEQERYYKEFKVNDFTLPVATPNAYLGERDIGNRVFDLYYRKED